MRKSRLLQIMSLAVGAMVLFSSTNLVARADTPAQEGDVGSLAAFWDQYDTDSSTTDDAVSQQYPDQDTSTAEIAEDFVVPVVTKPFMISLVEVRGRYTGSGGNMPSVRVRYYTASGSLPVTQIYSTTVAPMSDSNGRLVIAPGSPPLSSNTRYWISVQAVLNFGLGRQWYWAARDGAAPYLASNPSAYQTKSNFNTCFNIWGARVATCVVGDASAVDMSLRLTGFEVSNQVFIPIIVR
jgi:hypothetical protein